MGKSYAAADIILRQLVAFDCHVGVVAVTFVVDDFVVPEAGDGYVAFDANVIDFVRINVLLRNECKEDAGLVRELVASQGSTTFWFS